MTNMNGAMDYNAMMPGHMAAYEQILAEMFGKDGGYKNGTASKAAAYQARSGTYKQGPMSNSQTNDYMAKVALGFGMAIGAAYANKMGGQMPKNYGSSQATGCTCGDCPVHSAMQSGGLEDVLGGKSNYNQTRAKNFGAKGYNDKTAGAKSSSYSDSNAYRA